MKAPTTIPLCTPAAYDPRLEDEGDGGDYLE